MDPVTTSLMDLSRQYLTPDVLDKVASFTGESPAGAAKGLGASIPAVLGGLLQQSGNSASLAAIVSLFQQAPFDGSILTSLASTLSGTGAENLVKAGGPVLTTLFGTKSGSIGDLIATASGVKRSSAGAMLGMAAPIVFSLIGRQLAPRGGVTGSALRDLLEAQRPAITAAAPAGLSQALGLAEGPRGSYQPLPREEQKGPPSWMPWLIALLALLLLVPLVRSCGSVPPAVLPDTSAAPALTPAPAIVPDSVRPAMPPGTDTQPSPTGEAVPPGGAGGPSARRAVPVDSSAAPKATPAKDGAGAMGGQGTPGKQ